MEIGSKIRTLRMKKGVTQEVLAEALGVSFQAVSKWETNVTMPDITLLPALSVYFGVTIDELFERTAEARYEQLEAMLEEERMIKDEDFRYMEAFLMEQQKSHPQEGRPYQMLAELHAHRAESERELAAEYARMALEREPEVKSSHQILAQSMKVPAADWNVSNHHEYIEYYQEFVRKHPNYRSGYLWLLDALIPDRRFAEAEETLREMGRRFPGALVRQYEGLLELARGNEAEARKIWQRMLTEVEPEAAQETQGASKAAEKGGNEETSASDKWRERWIAVSSMADNCARLGDYEEAVRYYDEALELQPKPRYTDALESEAHIFEMQGRCREAVGCYERMIQLLAEEWKVTFGEAVDYCERQIGRLRRKL